MSDEESFSQSLKIPFLAKDALEYANDPVRSLAAEELIKREFGNADQLLVSKTRVELDGHTLVDLDAPEHDGADAQFTQQQTTSAPGSAPTTTDFDQSVAPKSVALKDVFLLRQVANGATLRVAVQAPLSYNHAQPSVLRQLLKELGQYRARSFEIDLNFCTNMSITGLGILLLVQKNIDADNTQVTIINSNPEITQLLKWAGMERYFSLKSL